MVVATSREAAITDKRELDKPNDPISKVIMTSRLGERVRMEVVGMTCEITVHKNEITIRTPLGKSMSEIIKILKEKIKWVTTKQKEFKEERVEIIKPIYED